jgi:hypothetical protein
VKRKYDVLEQLLNALLAKVLATITETDYCPDSMINQGDFQPRYQYFVLGFGRIFRTVFAVYTT